MTRLIEGIKRVYSIDLFDRNATFQWDLNQPVAKKYHESFQTVFDIGTIEHIFDTKQCLENYVRLVAVGGIVAIVTPINGYFGHGFHVFNPHTLIDAFELNNFSIEYCRYSTSTGLSVSDPAIRTNMLVFIVARKKKKIKDFVIPQQKYWADMYAEKSDRYQDTPHTYQNNNVLNQLKNFKREILNCLPISTRTWLLKHTR